MFQDGELSILELYGMNQTPILKQFTHHRHHRRRPHRRLRPHRRHHLLWRQRGNPLCPLCGKQRHPMEGRDKCVFSTRVSQTSHEMIF